MIENLSERLERSFKILKGEGRITEINVAETLKDVRRALLDADVNYKVAKTFTDTVKQKALGQNVLNSVKPGQLMVKIVHDELAALMGGQATEYCLILITLKRLIKSVLMEYILKMAHLKKFLMECHSKHGCCRELCGIPLNAEAEKSSKIFSVKVITAKKAANMLLSIINFSVT